MEEDQRRQAEEDTRLRNQVALETQDLNTN